MIYRPDICLNIFNYVPKDIPGFLHILSLKIFLKNFFLKIKNRNLMGQFFQS